MDPDQAAQYQHQLHQYLSGHSVVQLLLMSIVMATVGSPTLMVLHELGHALAARSRGLHVPVVRLGKKPILDLELAEVRFELGVWLWLRWWEPVRPGTDDLGSDPRDVLRVALAGPAMSVAIGVTAQVVSGATHGDLNVLLQLIAASGVGVAIWSLIPRTGRRGDSDGRRALEAISRLRSVS